VIFAISLFFAGVSGKFDRLFTSALALAIAVVIVVVTSVVMATLPIDL
jgi:hypothetical protein